MKTSFHARLINDPFSDPGLFIPFLYEKRAMMFDLGDVGCLASRDLLKLTHVFVTHTHIDHFIGFDALLRVFLGRDKTLHLFGPSEFIRQVEGKLAGYTWNLVEEYTNHFALKVYEVHPKELLTKTYVCNQRFRSAGAALSLPFDSGLLVVEPRFSVSACLLDHRIPCLGFCLNEKFTVNIMKEGLKELGLPVGPWLNRFKEAIYSGMDPDTDFPVNRRKKGGGEAERRFPLGVLASKIARITPGQKIAYVTDVLGSTENFGKIAQLAEGADHLFIEAPFLHSEKQTARRKYHLTAREAGELAGKARVNRLHLFHFSPRYRQREQALEQEATEAFKRARTLRGPQ